jgi:hypothetical protein
MRTAYRLKHDDGDSAGKRVVRNLKAILIPELILSRPWQLSRSVGPHAQKIK